MMQMITRWFVVGGIVCSAPWLHAAGPSMHGAADLAQQSNRPVASLTSAPIQNNWDFGIGSANAMRYTANIQPVLPFSISENWNLITRTILPLICAEGTTVGASSKFGLSDTVQSFFFLSTHPR